MLKLFCVILASLMLNSTVVSNQPKATIVSQYEDRATIEFVKGDVVNKHGISVSEINTGSNVGDKVPITIVEGKFYHELSDCLDSPYIHHQFRSDDGEVWWLLTEEFEIGHKPNTTDKYRLYYSNNGTTKENSPCDCSPEWDCECYLYDDIFLHIEKIS